MPCYHPLKAWRSRTAEPSGKRKLVFDIKYGYSDMEVQVPCGQCIGCRLEHSRQWAIRCVHEASMYKQNAFITLTYNKEKLPEGGTLVKKHFQDFMKRLRKKYEPRKIRFYQCGEYGNVYDDGGNIIPGLLGRPHYHACLFNIDFEDKKLWKFRDGIPLYRSATLESLWKLGYSTTGSVTFESAAYVARYVAKKITGERKETIKENGLKHYEKVDEETGLITPVLEEYTNMSRKPGLGRGFYEQYKNTDIIPHDTITLRGKVLKVPKYYTTILEQEDEHKYLTLKGNRKKEAKKREHDNTPERLQQKETVKNAQYKMLKRQL